MSHLGAAEIVLLSNLKCAGGTVLAHVPSRADGEITRDIDGQHTCVISVPRFDDEGSAVEWVRDVKRGQVLHTTLPNGQIFEWRIEKDAGWLAGDSTATITADPVEIDLLNAGMIYDLVGGVPDYSLSWVDESAEEVIERIVIPFLATKGIDWLSVGTIDSTVPLSGTAKSVNALQLLDALVTGIRESGTLVYLSLRRDGDSGYFIDLTADPSLGASEALVSEGLNLLDLQKSRGRDLATAIVARASEVEGFRAPPGLGMWEVADDSGPIVLQDKGGGVGPVVMNDQFVGNGLSGDKAIPTHYLLAPDGTHHEILGTTAPGTFELPAGSYSSFSTGDMVAIRPGDDGTLLHELVSPNIGEFGRVTRHIDIDGLGTARGQFSSDPLAGSWSSTPWDGAGGWASADADMGAGDPLQLTGLEPGVSIPSGSYVWQTNVRVGTTTSGATADSSGNVTLSVNWRFSSNSITTGTAIVLHRPANPVLPTGWSFLDGWGMVFRRPLTAAALTDLSCTTAVQTAGYVISLSGLTPGDVIYPGDILLVTNKFGAVVPVGALHGTEADASGNAHVVHSGTLDLSSQIDGGEAVTVSRPTFDAGTHGASYVLTFLSWADQFHGSPQDHRIRTRLSLVPYIAALPKLWASMWITLRSVVDVTLDGDPTRPLVALRDSSNVLASLSLEGSGDGEAIELTALEEMDLIGRVAGEISASGQYAVEIRSPGEIANNINNNVDWNGEIVMYLRAHELSLATNIGSDETAPLFGHRAVILHQEANRELSVRHGWPKKIEATGTEIIRAGASPEDVRVIGPGQTIRALTPSLSVDESLVIQRVRWSSEDPRDLSYVLAWRDLTLTEELSGSGVGGVSATSVSVSGGGGGGGSITDAYSKAEIDALLKEIYSKDQTDSKIESAVHDVRRFGDALTGSGKRSFGATATASTSILELSGSFAYDLFGSQHVGNTIVAYCVENDDIIRREGSIVAVNSAKEAELDFTFPEEVIRADVFWFDADQADDAAIQTAINAGGAAYLPSGVYVVESAGFTFNPELHRMFGDGRRASIILQKTDSGMGSTLSFDDVNNFVLEDLGFYGPGINGSLGGRVRFDRVTNGNINSLIVRNVEISGVAMGEGLYADTPILSKFENVRVRHVVGAPIRIKGGVAYDLVNCYGITCLTAGIHVDGGAGIGIQGCAAETAGVGILIDGAFCVEIDHSDCESLLDRIADAPSVPSPTAVAGGSVPAGEYYVSFSWVRQYNAFSFDIESMPSPVGGPVTIDASNATIELEIPARPNGLITKARVYITPTDGDPGTEGFVAEVSVGDTPTTYQRSTSFTPGSAPREWSWRGHAIVIDGSQHVTVNVPTMRKVPEVDSRFIYVTNSHHVLLNRVRRLISTGATPDWTIEITDSCSAVDIIGGNVPVAEISDSQVVADDEGSHYIGGKLYAEGGERVYPVRGTPSNGDVPVWSDPLGHPVWGAGGGGGGGASALNDLSDVTITSAAEGDFLRFNGTAWVDAGPDLSVLGVISRGATPATGGTGIRLTNGDILAWRNAANDGNLNGLGLNASDQLEVGKGATKVVLAAAGIETAVLGPLNVAGVVTFDTHVGIGTSDIEAWTSGRIAQEMGGWSAAFARLDGVGLVQNAYESSGWKYKYSGSFGSALYFVFRGDHGFWVAPSGTADGAITWVKALDIINAGTGVWRASTTAAAPMRIPHGSAPTSPVNGDVWTTTAGLYVRINGTTVGPLT